VKRFAADEFNGVQADLGQNAAAWTAMTIASMAIAAHFHARAGFT